MYTAPTCCAGVLVVGAQHGAARMLRRRGDTGSPMTTSVLVTIEADARGLCLAGLRDVEPLERRMIAHLVGRVAVRRPAI